MIMNGGDPGILCFQHSKNEPKCYSLNFPETCSFCDCELVNEELNILPFRIPFPFRSSSKLYNSVVIKPTLGDFLHSYENQDDLHIGVTDSKGVVYEFDSSGIKVTQGSSDWEQCLPIPVLLKPVTSSIKKYWDDILHETARKSSWKKERYHPELYNCYSFVLSFLQSLELEELMSDVTNKVRFCLCYVCPQTRLAAKYLTIFRKLKRNCSLSCVTFDE